MKTLPKVLLIIVLFASVILGRRVTPASASVRSGGVLNDQQASIVYAFDTGEIAVDAPVQKDLTSVNIDSMAGIFTGDRAKNLGGSFDNDTDQNIFKATFGSSFRSVSFGNVAQPGIDEAFLLNDLTVVGSLRGGGDFGPVDLVYLTNGPVDLLDLTDPSPFNASFSNLADVNAFDIDFASVQLGHDAPSVSFDLVNLAGSGGLQSTANMDLVEINATGNVNAFSTDLTRFTFLEPGQARSFSVSFDSNQIGRFVSDMELLFTNSSDLMEREKLRLRLTGTVPKPPIGMVIPQVASSDTLPSLVYDPMSGELSLITDIPLTAIKIDSASGIFTGPTPAGLLDGDFDNHDASNVFKSTFGDSFGAIHFGPIVQPGLSHELLLSDLSVIGSRAGGGSLDNVFLAAPVPEPSGIGLIVCGALGGLWWRVASENAPRSWPGERRPLTIRAKKR